MKESALLSVIVPVYNSREYLNNCIESILLQTYTNLEIICVDDGSSDGSELLLDSLSQRDARIKVIHQSNGGVSAARNRGIDEAAGQYITFVDSDDTLSPEMYQTLVGILEKEHADIAHCGYRRFEPDGSTKDILGTGEYLVQTSEQALNCLMNGTKFVGSLCNKIYRRSLFRNIRLPLDIRFNEDILTNVELFIASEKIVFYDLPLYHYFNWPSSATSTGMRLRKNRDSRMVAERIWNLLKDTSLKEDAANKLFLAYVGEYRALVYAGMSEHRDECRELAAKADRILPMCRGLSAKQRMNYRLLRIAPGFYKSAYRIYDRIRKPNWDVN